MAQNVTTVLEKMEITAEEIAASPLIKNFLYLIHGEGSSRSRKLDLDELKKFVNELTSIFLQKGIPGSSIVQNAEIDGADIKMYAEGEQLTDDSNSDLSRGGLAVVRTTSGPTEQTTVKPEGLSVKNVSGLVSTEARLEKDSVAFYIGNVKKAAVKYVNDGNNSRLVIESSVPISTASKIVSSDDVEADDVIASSILPKTGRQSVAFTKLEGNEVDAGTGKFNSIGGSTGQSIGVNSDVDFNDDVTFNGPVMDVSHHSFAGGVSCAIQQYNPDNQGDDVDVLGGSVIWLKPDNSDETVDLTDLLKGAYTGQRFTIISEKSVKLIFDINVNSKFYIDLPYKGSDFVVVTTTPDYVTLRPVCCAGNFTT